MGKLKLKKTSLEGVVLLEPMIFRDSRGFFLESYNKLEFEELGISDTFVQDNQSSSARGVLRGLHFQREHPQVKLVRVLKGKIFDVVVDIRKGSPTYGQHKGFFMSDDSQKMLYVPIGFAHGFIALMDDTEVMYKVTDYYHPQSDAGIIWNDPELGIIWPLETFGIRTPTVSDKDALLPPLSQIDSPFTYTENW